MKLTYKNTTIPLTQKDGDTCTLYNLTPIDKAYGNSNAIKLWTETAHFQKLSRQGTITYITSRGRHGGSWTCRTGLLLFVSRISEVLVQQLKTLVGTTDYIESQIQGLADQRIAVALQKEVQKEVQREVQKEVQADVQVDVQESRELSLELSESRLFDHYTKVIANLDSNTPVTLVQTATNFIEKYKAKLAENVRAENERLQEIQRQGQAEQDLRKSVCNSVLNMTMLRIKPRRTECTPRRETSIVSTALYRMRSTQPVSVYNRNYESAKALVRSCVESEYDAGNLDKVFMYDTAIERVIESADDVYRDGRSHHRITH